MKSVFDTNGWDRNNKEAQDIAENYVKQFLDKKNSKHFYQINISLNPFNPKYVRALSKGYNPTKFTPFIPVEDSSRKIPEWLQKAENDYREYVQNEANTLFTFTPLLLKNKLGAIIRGLDKNIPNMDGCYMEDYAKTLSNILGELELMFLFDLEGEQKVIKNQKMIDKALKKYLKLFNKNSSFLFSSGRMEKFYKVKNNGSLDGIEEIDKMRNRAEINYRKIALSKELSSADLRYLKMINSDGKVYLYDNYSIIPTDIQFKTESKPLKTPFWIKVKDFVLKTDMIDII